MGTIESLHGTTPAEIFNSGLENIEDIDAVALTVQWKDGTISAGWSNADTATLLLMISILQERLRQVSIASLVES